MKLRDFDLRALNSATKYPSIPTYHRLGEKGRLQDEVLTPLPERVEVTEKIDGTNTRIVIAPDEYLIGSREEWLTYTTDVIRNPAQGIVAALASLPGALVGRLVRSSSSYGVVVVYGEVYGGKINSAKEYTSSGAFGFRVFDVCGYEGASLEELCATHSAEAIAHWRDSGNQPFLDVDALGAFCSTFELKRVPSIAAGGPPSALADTSAWLSALVKGGTKAGIDRAEGGQAEGVVVRSPDRKAIAKLRIDDYRRSCR